MQKTEWNFPSDADLLDSKTIIVKANLEPAPAKWYKNNQPFTQRVSRHSKNSLQVVFEITDAPNPILNRAKLVYTFGRELDSSTTRLLGLPSKHEYLTDKLINASLAKHETYHLRLLPSTTGAKPEVIDAWPVSEQSSPAPSPAGTHPGTASNSKA